MNEKAVSGILKYGVYILIVLGLLVGFLDNYSSYYNNTTEGFGYALGATMPMAIGTFVAIYCANKNVSWASEMDRNTNWAFLIGIVFGLIGLLAYWIFYKMHIEQPSPESL